jgi:NTP pyrophosphatase (non-canonical NTP hydrolase)
MTTVEIINHILANGLVEEVYEILRQHREKEFEDVKHELSEHRATLRLIGKVTEDKTVKDILSD